MDNWREVVASLLAAAGVITLGWVIFALAVRLALGPLAGLLAWLAVTVQP